MKKLILTLAVFSALYACTSEQIYATGQNWQRNECSKLADSQERERCISQTRTSFDTYQQETK
jgi:hypothetical protein